MVIGDHTSTSNLKDTDHTSNLKDKFNVIKNKYPKLVASLCWVSAKILAVCSFARFVYVGIKCSQGSTATTSEL
jgi:hypothetical protein